MPGAFRRAALPRSAGGAQATLTQPREWRSDHLRAHRSRSILKYPRDVAVQQHMEACRSHTWSAKYPQVSMNPYSPGPAKQPPLLAGREVAHRCSTSSLQRHRPAAATSQSCCLVSAVWAKRSCWTAPCREAQERGWAALRVEAQRDAPLGVALANELAELYHQLPGRLGRPPRWLRQFKVSFGGHIAGAEVQVAPKPKPDYGRPPSIHDSLAEIALAGEPSRTRCVRGGRRDPPRTHERCPRAWALGPGRQR